MKTGIHPEIYDVVFVDTSTGAQFITTSTHKTDETMKIGGKEYYVIKVEISSDSHPFYTGKQKLVDTAGRVDKFVAKMKKAQAAAEKNVKKVDNDDDEEEVAETKEETKAEAPVKEEAKKEEPKAEEVTEETAEAPEAANDEPTEEAAPTEETPEEEKAA